MWAHLVLVIDFIYLSRIAGAKNCPEEHTKVLLNPLEQGCRTHVPYKPDDGHPWAGLWAGLGPTLRGAVTVPGPAHAPHTARTMAWGMSAAPGLDPVLQWHWEGWSGVPVPQPPCAVRSTGFSLRCMGSTCVCSKSWGQHMLHTVHGARPTLDTGSGSGGHRMEREPHAGPLCHMQRVGLEAVTHGPSRTDPACGPYVWHPCPRIT